LAARWEDALARGYWLAFVDVTDPEGYKEYIAANAVPFAKFGARFLVRGGQAERPEGSLRQRIVVIEFADYETALACHRSHEYAAAMAKRQGRALIDLAIVEGYDGPQPTDT
jgi:uncharacterized protein (DUF1330 family)